MKKILLLALAALCLAGCKKGGGADEQPQDYYFVGAKWVMDNATWMVTEDGFITLYGQKYYPSALQSAKKCYYFLDKTRCSCYWEDKDGYIIAGEDGALNYTYSEPDITINEKDGSKTRYRFVNKWNFSLVKDDGTIDNRVTFHMTTP